MMKHQVIAKIAGKTVAKASPAQVLEGIRTMANAYSEWQRITEQEQTKRLAIEAWRQCQMKKLTDQRALMENYFEHTFSERAGNFKELFSRLDQGISENNPAIIQTCLSAIIDIAKTSPITGIKDIFNALDDPNVKEITI